MIVFVVGDTKPAPLFVIKTNNKTVDLTGYLSATLKLRRPGGTTVTKTLTFVDRPAGLVGGSWAAGDLSEGGDQYAELELVDAAGNLQRSERPIHYYGRQPYTEVTP